MKRKLNEVCTSITGMLTVWFKIHCDGVQSENYNNCLIFAAIGQSRRTYGISWSLIYFCRAKDVLPCCFFLHFLTLLILTLVSFLVLFCKSKSVKVLFAFCTRNIPSKLLTSSSCWPFVPSTEKLTTDRIITTSTLSTNATSSCRFSCSTPRMM